MEKEAFNREKEAFSGGPCKRTTEETSEVFCVEGSVVWCRDLDTDGMSRNNWKHLRCGYGEGWSV